MIWYTWNSRDTTFFYLKNRYSHAYHCCRPCFRSTCPIHPKWTSHEERVCFTQSESWTQVLQWMCDWPTSLIFSRNVASLDWMALSPTPKGFDCLMFSFIWLSRPSMVVKRPPSVPDCTSKSNSGMLTIAVSACKIEETMSPEKTQMQYWKGCLCLCKGENVGRET